MSRQTSTHSLQQNPGATSVTRGLLQRTCGCGNHTMAAGECAECSRNQLFGAQTKLRVSEPGDVYEQEADRVADYVMRVAEQNSQRQAEYHDEEELLQSRLLAQAKSTAAQASEAAPPAAVRTNRGLSPCDTAALQSIEGGEEETQVTDLAVQRKAEPRFTSAVSSTAVVDRLARTQTSGEPLAPGTRKLMEAAFGRDFARVRVHHDDEAAEISRQLSALAFTYGSHVYFGSGKYNPEASSGKRLLAHELTHVAQQGRATLKRGGDTVPTSTTVQTTLPTIQRVATWTPPAVHQTNNLADTALAGAPAGVTVPTLNGAVGGALNAPTVTVTPVAAGGFDATVTTVPANTGSVDETVLAPGPWRRVAARATIGALFPALAQCAGAGNSNFRARGNPSDAAMFAANRRHEDRHAADGQAAFNGSVVPWDARLTAANAAGTTFHGATGAAARAALDTAMGGSAATIRGAFVTAWNAAIPVYHGTAAGGPIGAPTDPTAAGNCAWSFARYTNPS